MQVLTFTLASSRHKHRYSRIRADIDHVDVDVYGIHTNRLFRNAAIPILYEQALARETGSALTSTGALVTSSGHKTGNYSSSLLCNRATIGNSLLHTYDYTLPSSLRHLVF